MKIPESRAAVERFDVRHDPAQDRNDPHVPEDPGIMHGFPADRAPRIAEHNPAFAFGKRNRPWVAFCGASVRVILPQSFDTDDSAACPRCVELATLWAAPNVELTRKEARRIAEMVNALPDAIFASGTSELMQQAGIECFFGHARTLIEFLLIKPSGHSFDLTARHTLAKSAWTPELEPDGQLKKKLTTTWWMASQHQAHFTINRPAELPYGQSDLREIADELLSVWDQFATASDHPDVPHRTDFSMFR